jgi:hypothetical protein
MKRILATIVVVCGLLAISISAAGGFSSSTPLRPGISLVITCPNALTNTNVQTNTETVNCARDVPPSRTTMFTQSPGEFTQQSPAETTTSAETTTTTTTEPLTTTTSEPVTTTTTTEPVTTTTTEAITPTATTQPAVGGNCTSPVYWDDGASATYNTDPNDAEYYWVNNDAWSGSHGPQAIYVCNQSSWYAVSDQTNNGGQVETYPDTEYDVGGRNTPSTTPISGWDSITSTFSEAYPSAGGWDAGYDLWTDNWTNETMVWNQWAGSQSFWASCGASTDPESACGVPQSAQNINIGGVLYNFVANGPGGTTKCTTANEADCELMFFRQSQVASGSVDLAAVFQWEVANGYAKASDVPTQLEYGVEICYTVNTETFPTTGLTFSLSS